MARRRHAPPDNAPTGPARTTRFSSRVVAAFALGDFLLAGTFFLLSIYDTSKSTGPTEQGSYVFQVSLRDVMALCAFRVGFIVLTLLVTEASGAGRHSFSSVFNKKRDGYGAIPDQPTDGGSEVARTAPLRLIILEGLMVLVCIASFLFGMAKVVVYVDWPNDHHALLLVFEVLLPIFEGWFFFKHFIASHEERTLGPLPPPKTATAAADDEEGKAGGGGEDSTKELSRWQLAGLMKPYFWPRGTANRCRAVGTYLLLGLSKTSNLFGPIFIGNAAKALGESPPNLGLAVQSVAAYCALGFCTKAFKELQNMVYLNVKQTAYIEIAEKTFWHLHSLSVNWHVKKKMGNVLRSMDRGVNSANTVVTYLFLYLFPTLFECLVVCAIFWTRFHNPPLALTAFLGLLLYGFATVKITLWRKQFREKSVQHDNDYHDKATDSLVNYETVKYFTNEQFETQRYISSVRQFQQNSTATQRSLNVLNVIQALVMQFTLSLVLLGAAHAVANPLSPVAPGADGEAASAPTSGSTPVGESVAAAAAAAMRFMRLDVGDFVAVNMYIVQLFAPLSFLGSIYNAVINSVVDMANLSQLLAITSDVRDAPGAGELPPPAAGGSAPEVEFRDVSFDYPGTAVGSGLKNVSFRLRPGTTTAIVGTSGAGKTTVSRLLFRFYDPRGGAVVVGGRDVRGVTQRSLRKLIGVVSQDTVLFNDSIRYNLVYAKRDATQEELDAAAKAAQIYDFIHAQKDGWDTRVGERGLMLSGGQKQRVAIARVLLKNPPIVLLDEATSSLDPETEKLVQESLSALSRTSSSSSGPRTMLVIAHRLSTVESADQTIVMEHGCVVQAGTHAELKEVEGKYKQMWELVNGDNGGESSGLGQQSP